MMRKFNLDDGDEIAQAAARQVAEAKAIAKGKQFLSDQVKLAADEKRWLRKKRLAITKLRNIVASKRRLKARVRAFEKTLKGQNI